MENNYRYLIICDWREEGVSPVVAYGELDKAIKAAKKMSLEDTHYGYRIIDMKLLEQNLSSIEYWNAEIEYE